MKKILLVFTCLIVAKNTNAQSWNLTLNAISGNPNFGTSSNHPINFFTNGTQRMTLSTTGSLRINGLAGTGNRFLQADANGNLVAWTGSGLDANKVLYGDGAWRSNPFSFDGSSVTTSNGATKLGIGIISPANALDVSGDVSATGFVKAPGGFMFSATEGASFSSTDNVITLGKLGAGSPAIDPCLVLANSSVLGWVSAPNFGFVTSQINPPTATSVNAAMRMFIEPTNGSAYIEVSGKDNFNLSNNSLYLNYNCNRNTRINTGANGGYVYLGSSSAASKVFVGDFINMNKHVEIGDPTTGITNAAANTALDINVNSGKGLRFQTTTNTIPLITVENNSNSVLKEAFKIYGDGKTEINTENSEALVIKDPLASGATAFKLLSSGAAEISSNAVNALVVSSASGGPNNFRVLSNGVLEIMSPAQNAFTIKNGNTGPNTFNVKSSGVTEITTAATKAFAVYNANNSNNETFSVNNNGYSEIKVYSPSGMPVPSYGSSAWPITNPRVITVRDMTFNSNAGRDLFVVRADGTVFAREIEINNGDNFPDYVFDKDYKLLSVKEVADFIKTNKHLPGFERAEYYEKNGIAVNALIIKQQEKIEELTLYIIAQEKMFEQQEMQIQDQEKRLRLLECKK